MAEDDFKLKISAEGIDRVIKSMEELITLQKEILVNQANAAQGAKEFKEVGEQAETAFKKAATGGNKLVGALKTVGSGIGKVGKGVVSLGKGVGNAIGKFSKFTGITTILAAAGGAFKGNQKIVDAWNTTMSAVTSIVGEASEAIFKNVEAVGKQNGGFDATQKLLGGALKVALNGLVVILQSVKLVTLQVQKAWEDSIFGSGDTEKIKKLGKEIDETKTKISDAGKEVVEGGKAIINNFGEAVGEVADGITAVADGVKTTVENLDLKRTIKDATRLTELNKQAEAAEIRRQEIQLKYQKTQEELRQGRDDEQKNISERIASNDKLLKSQEEQYKLEKEQIGIQVNAAALAYKLEKTDENKNKLAQARLALSDLEERITGQRSEALANQNSLLKEQKDIIKTNADAEQESVDATKRRNVETEAFNKKQGAEKIQGAIAREQALFEIEQDRLKKILDIEKEIYDDRSKKISDQMAEMEKNGQTETQAYADLLAQKKTLDTEYADKKMELDNQVTENKTQNDLKQIQLEKDKAIAIQDLTVQLLGDLSSLAEVFSKGDSERAKKAFAVSKALNLGQTILATYLGITNALADKKLIELFPANILTAASIGIQGLANVAKIKQTKFEGGGDAGAAGESAPKPRMYADGGLLMGPDHSRGGIKTRFGELEGGEYVVNRNATQSFLPLLSAINESGKRKYQDGGISGISETLEKAMGAQRPQVIKTYVLASDVSSQQEADKRISDIARL